MLSSEYLVHEINRLDIRHRKGWLPSEGIGAQVTGQHLADEVNELLLELAWYADPNCTKEEVDRAEIKQEMGDVFACLLQIAYRFGWSFEEINQEAVRKLRLRFIGADRIKISEGGKIDTLPSTTSVRSDSVLLEGPDGERTIYTRGLPCS